MAQFRYRAVDPDGNPVEGVMEEASARRVVPLLQEQGLSVNGVNKVGGGGFEFMRRNRLSWQDLSEFNDQLLTITKSGLPLAPALKAMASDVRKAKLRNVLDDIQRQVEAGNTLESALTRHPGSFSPVYVSLVRSGERAGNIAAVFECLTTYSRRMVDLRSSIQEMLAYPLMLILAAFAIVVWILVKVVPVMAEIFKDFGGELPAPTKLVLRIGDLFVHHSLIWLSVSAVILVIMLKVFVSFLHGESSGPGMDRIKLHIPGLGRVYAMASLARFCRALGLLLQARVPMLASLELAAASAGNAVLTKAVRYAGRQVANGATLAEGLKESRYFDHSFCWLLAQGEQRGELAESLLLLDEDQERSVDRMRKWIMMVTGPAVVVCVAILVGFLVISMYLPIFSLGDVISGT